MADGNGSRRASALPRWLVIAAWASGPAALYALLGLAHALLVERSLTVDVGFGRSLAFWVVSAYLALLLWGFLPRQPSPRLAQPGVTYPALAVGVLGLLVCGGFTLAWLGAHWNRSIGMPVLGAMVVMVAAAVGTLWLADRAGAPRP